MKATLEKLYTLLSSDSQLRTLLNATVSNTKITPMITDQFEDFPCITYEVVEGSFRTVPKKVEDMVVEIRIWIKARPENGSFGLLEDIHTRVNTLLNYYVERMNPIVYMRQDGEFFIPEQDRQLYSKVVRYRLWTYN